MKLYRSQLIVSFKNVSQIYQGPVFIAEMGLLLLGLLLAGLSPNAVWLIGGLLIVGLALGADYPTAHLVIAESCPARLRGRLVLGAFSFQALGVVSGTALVALVLRLAPQLDAWRLFYLMPILPVLLLTGHDPAMLGAAEAVEELWQLSSVRKVPELPDAGQLLDFLFGAGRRGTCISMMPV